jgi:hypothetical protein
VEGSAELDEHREDSLEQLFASLMGFGGDEAASQTDIEWKKFSADHPLVGRCTKPA